MKMPKREAKGASYATLKHTEVYLVIYNNNSENTIHNM